MKVQINDVSDIPQLAERLIQEAGDLRVWCFEGEMGAGKTTLIAALCSVLGVEDHVGSPSFGLVNTYSFDSGAFVYHFDFYRINSLQEAFELGVEDLFFSGNYCFIEWPQKVEALLPTEVFRIKFDIFEGSIRTIQTEHVS